MYTLFKERVLILKDMVNVRNLLWRENGSRVVYFPHVYSSQDFCCFCVYIFLVQYHIMLHNIL